MTKTDSPALTERSEYYPRGWGERVPKLVRVTRRVYSDVPKFYWKPPSVLLRGSIVECWVNKHGAVSGRCTNGQLLGLKPDEFEVVEWHEDDEEEDDDEDELDDDDLLYEDDVDDD